MTNKYTKNAGSALFYGNRTKSPFLPEGNHTFTPRCITPPGVIAYVYRWQKKDIPIQPGSNVRTDGGYLIWNSYTPIAYESVEIGTGPDGSGNQASARIQVTGGNLANGDKLTFGTRSITLRTDGVGVNNIDVWNIPASPLSSQLSQIGSNLTSASYNTIVPKGPLFTYTVENSNTLVISGVHRNNIADGTPIGLTAANGVVTITGVASNVNAQRTIQNVKFQAVTAGAAGNLISITYSTKSGSAPVVSVNQGNAIDIQIQNGVTNAQQIIDAVNAVGSPLTGIIVASLANGVATAPQSSPVTQTFLDGGAHYVVNPWTRGDVLKNCFIPSPKQMYGYNNYQANSSTINEIGIPVNTILMQSYHVLQLLPHPTLNYGAWFRKNTAKNATVKLPGSTTYRFLELELIGAAAGTAGNTYTFEIRQHPGFGLNSQTATPAKMTLENSGKRIVLTLGINGGNPSSNPSFTDVDDVLTAINNGDKSILNIVKPVSFGAITSLGANMAEIPFTGGTDVAGSDVFKDGSFDITWGAIRRSTFGLYDAIGELDVDGTSRQANDLTIQTSGKFGCAFARVVPAGTPFKAYGYITDLMFRAVAGGVSGNSITVQYTSGATAGAEVVTVVGNAISVQVSNTATTAAQIKTAIEASSAASALVSVTVIGTANSTQSSTSTPSPVSLAKGAVGLANDAGYVMMPRFNAGQADTYATDSGSMTYEVMFSFNLNDPSSFKHVCWVYSEYNASSLALASQRIVAEFIDTRLNGKSSTQINFYTANNTFTAPTVTRTMTERNSYWETTGVRIESAKSGSQGEGQEFRVITGAVLGNEAVSISGNVVTLTIAQGQSTIAHIQTAIAANAPAAALIRVVPQNDSYTTAYVMNFTVLTATKLLGGFEFWPHEGHWGFGSVNVNEYDFYPNGIQVVTPRKSPRSYSKMVAVEGFRLTKVI